MCSLTNGFGGARPLGSPLRSVVSLGRQEAQIFVDRACSRMELQFFEAMDEFDLFPMDAASDFGAESLSSKPDEAQI